MSNIFVCSSPVITPQELNFCPNRHHRRQVIHVDGICPLTLREPNIETPFSVLYENVPKRLTHRASRKIGVWTRN